MSDFKPKLKSPETATKPASARNHTRQLPVAAATPVREVDAEQLLMGASALAIRLAGERYILRLTSKHKLILTK